MNKYEKALNNVRKFEREHNMSKFGDVVPQPNSDTLQELVDKEIPMKPIRYNINQYKCPKCKNQIKGQKWLYNMETKRRDIKCKMKIIKIYCPYCGQKLYWGDECE